MINNLGFTQQMLEAFQPILPTDCITPLHLACNEGHLDTVKYLVDVCKCNPNHSIKSGLAAIDFAQIGGHEEVVCYLRNEHSCSKNLGKVMNSAISKFSGMNCDHLFEDSFNEMYFSPLDIACIAGNLEEVILCTTKSNYNSSSTGFLGCTPLMFASMMGHLEIAMYLITKHKCSPDHANTYGFTPLHYAAFGGHLAVVQYLTTQHNCNRQCRAINGSTPLHVACYYGHLHIAKYLIEEQKCQHEPEARISHKTIQFFLPPLYKQVETEVRVFNGIIPLHLACMRGHLNTVKYLIEVCNCNPDHSTSNGLTAIDFAHIQGHQEVVSYLRDKHQCSSGWGQVVSSATSRFLNSFFEKGSLDSICFDVNDMYFSQLQRACGDGNLALVKCYATKSNCKSSASFPGGFTPLHIACMMGHLEVAKYLVTECECDPKCSGTLFYHQNISITPLISATILGQLKIVRWLVDEQKCEPVYYDCQHKQNLPLAIFACSYGHLDVMKYLLSGYNSQDLELHIVLLCTVCLLGHLNVVKYLIDKYKCNPHFTDGGGNTLLHYACGGIQYFKERECHMSVMSTPICSMQGILQILLTIINLPITLLLNVLPNVLPGFFKSSDELSINDIPSDNQSGEEQLTPYNHRCLDIVKYLITEHKCNPHCINEEGQTPLHYACASGQLEVVQYFHNEKLSDLVHTAHSGDTPLHFACKYNQVGIVQLLLSTGECDPLIKNAEGLTSVESVSSPEIRKLLDHFCKGKYPLESVVKVFVLGDPMTGKSSLVQAIQNNPSFLNSLVGRFLKVKGVRQQTAGIDSFTFSSSEFGNIVIYDFAGQREFFTSHAAFLQNSYVPGIFILLANIADHEDNICQSVQYWLSFIQECCAHMHSKTKPCIIIIGSHADQLDEGTVEKALSTIGKCFPEHSDNCNQFYEIEGVICLDCTRPSSPGLDLLRHHLKESCNSIRQKTEKIDQRCYVLHKYVNQEYINMGIHGSKLENISKDLEGNPYLLPSTSTELLPLFQTLHDKGQVILLRNKHIPGNSWVITNIAALLETIIGSIFAPHDFPQHIASGSTGIVSKSRMSEHFPDHNIDMIIGFVEHFEFCHQVGLDWVRVTESKQGMSDDDYYLFPALVKSENTPQVLHESCASHYHCGWFMHSTAKHEFFTTRFLHVLLLRLAFLFALPQDNAMHSEDETPDLKRSCTMWKSGITWHDTNGVSAFFEVRDFKTVILIMSSIKDNEIHCVRLRTQLLKTILKAKKEFCPRVDVEECIMEIQNENCLQEVEKCPSKTTKYSLKYLSDQISTRDAKDHQDLLLVYPDGSPGKRISQLLYFEPYTLLTSELIAQLFSKEHSKLILSDAFISELAGRLYQCNNILAQIFKPPPRILMDRFKSDANVLDSLDEISKQLRCEHILEAWMEQQESPATYKKLRQELNKYSIFCERNPLDMVCNNINTYKILRKTST